MPTFKKLQQRSKTSQKFQNSVHGSRQIPEFTKCKKKPSESQIRAEAAELVWYLEDLDPGVQQKPKANSPLPAWLYSRKKEVQRWGKKMKVPALTATIGSVGRTVGGWGGGSHNTENKPGCYKSTKFPPVTQHVSASFVSGNSFFPLLLKRHFFPQQPFPCGKYIAQKYKWWMLLNIYIYIFVYIYIYVYI